MYSGWGLERFPPPLPSRSQSNRLCCGLRVLRARPRRALPALWKRAGRSEWDTGAMFQPQLGHSRAVPVEVLICR